MCLVLWLARCCSCSACLRDAVPLPTRSARRSRTCPAATRLSRRAALTAAAATSPATETRGNALAPIARRPRLRQQPGAQPNRRSGLRGCPRFPPVAELAADLVRFLRSSVPSLGPCALVVRRARGPSRRPARSGSLGHLQAPPWATRAGEQEAANAKSVNLSTGDLGNGNPASRTAPENRACHRIASVPKIDARS